MNAEALRLVVMTDDLVPSYQAALERGWSPVTTADKSREMLAQLLENREVHLLPFRDEVNIGEDRPHLSRVVRWLWDGEFCGYIQVRYRPGTDEVSDRVLGHLGYSVVPWRHNRGYATQALTMMLPEARRVGLTKLYAVCKPDNVASHRVLEKVGAVMTEERIFPDYNPEPRRRYVLAL
jgi:predicted acetyltransferase